MARKSTKDRIVPSLSGLRLAECRKEAGLKQKELADLVHVTLQHISNIERGKRNMSLELARDFSNLFGVREEYLLGEDNISTNYENEKALESLNSDLCCIEGVFERLGFYYSDFSGKTAVYTEEAEIKNQGKETAYVCRTEDFNYLASSIVNAIKAEITFFIEKRCHEMTDEERAEEKEAKLQAYADQHGVPRSSVSVTDSGVYLINGKIPPGFHAVFRGQEEDYKKYSSKRETAKKAAPPKLTMLSEEAIRAIIDRAMDKVISGPSDDPKEEPQS